MVDSEKAEIASINDSQVCNLANYNFLILWSDGIWQTYPLVSGVGITG